LRIVFARTKDATTVAMNRKVRRTLGASPRLTPVKPESRLIASKVVRYRFFTPVRVFSRVS
jgi:hypothetical protein